MGFAIVYIAPSNPRYGWNRHLSNIYINFRISIYVAMSEILVPLNSMVVWRNRKYYIYEQCCIPRFAFCLMYNTYGIESNTAQNSCITMWVPISRWQLVLYWKSPLLYIQLYQSRALPRAARSFNLKNNVVLCDTFDNQTYVYSYVYVAINVFND